MVLVNHCIGHVLGGVRFVLSEYVYGGVSVASELVKFI